MINLCAPLPLHRTTAIPPASIVKSTDMSFDSFYVVDENTQIKFFDRNEISKCVKSMIQVLALLGLSSLGRSDLSTKPPVLHVVAGGLVRTSCDLHRLLTLTSLLPWPREIKQRLLPINRVSLCLLCQASSYSWLAHAKPPGGIY